MNIGLLRRLVNTELLCSAIKSFTGTLLQFVSLGARWMQESGINERMQTRIPELINEHVGIGWTGRGLCSSSTTINKRSSWWHHIWLPRQMDSVSFRCFVIDGTCHPVIRHFRCLPLHFEFQIFVHSLSHQWFHFNCFPEFKYIKYHMSTKSKPATWTHTLFSSC